MNSPKIVYLSGSRGKDIKVCACHVHLVGDHKWNVMQSGHVARSVWTPSRSMVYMHRVIAGTPANMKTDHINNDPTDNTCWNLRICQQAQNVGNSRLSRRNTSGYKGVCWHGQVGKWRAYLNSAGKQKSLGIFNTKEEAALAYNRAAIEKWGEYAWTNRVKKP